MSRPKPRLIKIQYGDEKLEYDRQTLEQWYFLNMLDTGYPVRRVRWLPEYMLILPPLFLISNELLEE